MPTPQEANAKKDPVNQITDWDRIKQDLETHYHNQPPTIAASYHAYLQVQNLTLSLLDEAPSSVSCRFHCETTVKQVKHQHSPPGKYTKSQSQAEEYARRTVELVETFFQTGASGGGPGVKWNVKGEVKTKDEVIEEVKTSVHVSTSSERVFVLKDPEDCAPVCGEHRRYYGAFTNVTFYGTIEVRRYFDYDAGQATIKWHPGFVIVPQGDVRINIDSTVDWLPPKFHWYKEENCDHCQHALLLKEGMANEAYAALVYDAFDPAIIREDIPDDLALEAPHLGEEVPVEINIGDATPLEPGPTT